MAFCGPRPVYRPIHVGSILLWLFQFCRSTFFPPIYAPFCNSSTTILYLFWFLKEFLNVTLIDHVLFPQKKMTTCCFVPAQVSMKGHQLSINIQTRNKCSGVSCFQYSHFKSRNWENCSWENMRKLSELRKLSETCSYYNQSNWTELDLHVSDLSFLNFANGASSPHPPEAKTKNNRENSLLLFGCIHSSSTIQVTWLSSKKKMHDSSRSISFCPTMITLLRCHLLTVFRFSWRQKQYSSHWYHLTGTTLQSMDYKQILPSLRPGDRCPAISNITS